MEVQVCKMLEIQLVIAWLKIALAMSEDFHQKLVRWTSE